MRLLLLLLPLLLLGCPPSEFTPGTPDAGFVEEGVTADDIGLPCEYDATVGGNPTNNCPAGTECVIVTRDGAFNTLGMSLPFWEDQLTVAVGNNIDVGYCSLVGNAATPPACPLGTIVKFVSSPAAPGGLAAVCLKPCSASAECGGDRVCDVRFADAETDGIPFCVSPCRADLSHCVRSGIIQADQNFFTTGLFFGDLSGDAACNIDTGLCVVPSKDPTGTDGAQCASAADCAAGLACYQPQLFTNPPDFGFCAKRCTVQQQEGGRPEQGSCDAGEACQPGLAFGYNPVQGFAGMLVFDQTGVATREGICLDICIEGDTECVAGATCGATNANVTGQAPIPFATCAPEAILGAN